MIERFKISERGVAMFGIVGVIFTIFCVICALFGDKIDASNRIKNKKEEERKLLLDRPKYQSKRYSDEWIDLFGSEEEADKYRSTVEYSRSSRSKSKNR